VLALYGWDDGGSPWQRTRANSASRPAVAAAGRWTAHRHSGVSARSIHGADTGQTNRQTDGGVCVTRKRPPNSALSVMLMMNYSCWQLWCDASQTAIVLWRQERRLRNNQARQWTLSDVSLWKDDAARVARTVRLVSLLHAQYSLVYLLWYPV